jgi:hypothetical protein
VSSPWVIIVCLFKFSCVTLIGCLHFMFRWPLFSLHWVLVVVFMEFVCSVCETLLKYTLFCWKWFFRQVNHSYSI